MNKSTQELPNLIPAKEAARQIGLPYTSLRDHVFRGAIPVFRSGRAWYFDRRDLARFIERSKEKLGEVA
jgi:hypothetical protein